MLSRFSLLCDDTYTTQSELQRKLNHIQMNYYCKMRETANHLIFPRHIREPLTRILLLILL
jgi:hypothetical protein